MTTTEQSAIQPERIDAPPGGRLAALTAQYADLTLRADEINARLDVTKDALKAEIARERPGATDIYLYSEALETPLRLWAQTTWRLDTKALKATIPTIYARFAKQSTSWVLRRVNG